VGSIAETAANVITGDPTYCEGCGSILNSLSTVSKNEDNTYNWKWQANFKQSGSKLTIFQRILFERKQQSSIRRGRNSQGKYRRVHISPPSSSKGKEKLSPN
jgi:hypothetical protein